MTWQTANSDEDVSSVVPCAPGSQDPGHGRTETWVSSRKGTSRSRWPECDLPSHTCVHVNILQLCPQKGKIPGPVTDSEPRVPGVHAAAWKDGSHPARRPGRAADGTGAGPGQERCGLGLGRLAAEATKRCGNSSRARGARQPRGRHPSLKIRTSATCHRPTCAVGS